MMTFNYLIVIVNYNDSLLTSKCIRSLLEASADTNRIIVINNGTIESSNVKSNYRQNPYINIIDLQENFGYADALNIGIKFGIERQVDWFILLNNDIEAEPGFLTAIQNAIEDHPGDYIFGPKIVYLNNPSKIWYFTEKKILNSPLTINSYRNKDRNTATPLVVPSDSLSGSAMIIHTSVFRKVGLFDDRYFLYGEEIDFLWRAKQEGYSLSAVTNAVVRHGVSITTSKTVKVSFYRIRNQAWFYRKFSPGALLPILCVFTFIKLIICAVFADIGGQKVSYSCMFDGWKRGWFSAIQKS